jgi:hypothetical protein
LTFRPEVFDRHVAAFDIAGFAEAFAEGGHVANCPDEPPWRNPTTGIAGCWALAASGQATAAPPASDMNSRRLMSNMGLPSSLQ